MYPSQLHFLSASIYLFEFNKKYIKMQFIKNNMKNIFNFCKKAIKAFLILKKKTV